MFIASKKATRLESREPPKLATKGGADGQLAKKIEERQREREIGRKRDTEGRWRAVSAKMSDVPVTML